MAVHRQAEAQARANARTAWVLVALAGLFGLGFVVRIVLFGG
ncbi:MAG: hypothetical protein ABIR94_04810 [Rubrivivax sp.]